MAQQAGEDNAKKARRHTERVIKSLRPPTRLGKLAVWVAPYVVGPAVEYGVRLAEERGPELVGKGASIAKEKAPMMAATVKDKAPVVARAAKTEVIAAAQATREKGPVVARTARDKALHLAERVQERRQARREERRRRTGG